MTYSSKPINTKDLEEARKMSDSINRAEDLISRTELIRKLKHLEKFNNSDVPEWIWCAIGGTK